MARFTIRVERKARNELIWIPDNSIGITVTVLRTGATPVDELVDVSWLEPVT
jgi:hypothetical protein